MSFIPRRYPSLFVSIVLVALLSATSGFARDTAIRQPIEDAMQTSTAKSYTGVQFFFGDQSHPEVASHKGNFTSKKTTNAFGKSDQASCQWAFLSAIKSLHQRALSEGGDGVINIMSVTTGGTVSSQTEFVCRAGNVVSKVYLTGDVVKF